MPAAAQSRTEPFPRRSRRKLQTRERIIGAAGVLFRQVGYEDATMAAIAEAADIHVTTLFTHFKSKRDLGGAIAERSLERLRGAIEANRGHVRFFDFMRAAVTSATGEYQRDAEFNLSIGRQFGADPEVTARWMDYERRQIELLAGYIAHDFGLDRTGDYRPMLVANMIVGGKILVHERWVKSDGQSDLLGENLAMIEAVEGLVKNGLSETGGG
jgi:AcrR family transcriptional regulator